MDNKILGNKGENLAYNYLKKQGLKILERNYKNKIGEIDIICYNQKENETCFVEVKTRSSKEFGFPCEAVNFRKQQKIKKVAELYLIMHKKLNSKVRFDVLEVLDNEITYIKYAF